MKTFRNVLIWCMTLGLTACSTVAPAPTQEPVAAQNQPTLSSVAFPPTWTPDVVPTKPAASATPALIEPSNVENDAQLSFQWGAATPVSPQLPINTWQRVEGATATFMLPQSFEVLDMGSEFGVLMAALMTGLMESMVEVASEIGEEFGATPISPTPFDTTDLESAFNLDFVLAMQADQKTSAFLFSEPLEEPSTLEEQVEAILDEQENASEIVSIDEIIESRQETARLHLIATDGETGERGHVLIYVILLNERVYQLGYTTDFERFEELLPIFEASASTFQVIT